MKKRIIAWLLGLLTEEGFVFAFGSDSARLMLLSSRHGDEARLAASGCES
jgi:hypothetical protein